MAEVSKMKEQIVEGFDRDMRPGQSNKDLHICLIRLLVIGELLTIFNYPLAHILHDLNQTKPIMDYLYLVSAISLVFLFSAVILTGIFGYKEWLSETYTAMYAVIATALVLPAIWWTVILIAILGG